MADNVYLLETRLSPGQQSALEAIRTVARQQGLTVFLVGGAVRDLMSGSPVRDLDVAVQGNAMSLRGELERAGAEFSGQSVPLQSLFIRFPTGVRVEVGSTLSVSYPKPGKPVYQPATILEDLRRRDFTANAMAISLNEGSYGLLMDPLNGVADIENRELRLVSNYGFIEDPSRLIRAARFMARLGWQMDERTRSRYDTAKEENYIAAWQSGERGYELEELFHEEEPLRVMRRLEDEGWLKDLSPVLTVAKANAPELTRLRDAQMQLATRGIRADAAAANFPLLTTKIAASEVEALKKGFPRTAFVAEINSLEGSAKELASQLSSKAMALPSEAYKLLLRSDPVVILWTLHTSKSATLQARFKSFLTEWPQAQQKIPVLLMTEMRITPEVPGYDDLQETLFYALMDGRLTTPEEMKAFLEPFSPPAPPPPVSLRRPRTPRKEAKTPKSRKKAAAETPLVAPSDTPEPTQQEAVPAVAPEKPAPVPSRKKTTKVESVAAETVSKLTTPKRDTTTTKPAPAKKAAVSALVGKPSAKRPVKASAAPAAKTKSKAVKAVPTASMTKKGATAGSASTKKGNTKAAPAKTKVATPPRTSKKVAGKPVPSKKVAAKQSGKKKIVAKKVVATKTSSKRR